MVFDYVTNTCDPINTMEMPHPKITTNIMEHTVLCTKKKYLYRRVSNSLNLDVQDLDAPRSPILIILFHDFKLSPCVK
jgi:hypothetical protein